MNSIERVSCEFPDYIVSKVLSFLDGHEVARLALVSRQWLEVCRTDSELWRTLVNAEFGPITPSPTVWRDVYIHENDWRRRGFCRRELVGHRGDVKCLQFDRDQIISGSHDCTIRVWELESGRCTSVFSPALGCIFALKYDDERIVAGGSNSDIGVYDKVTGNCLRTLSGHEDWVTCLGLNEGKTVSGSHDELLKLWDVETSQNIQTWRGHKDWVRCLQMTGHQLMSGSNDQTVRLWDLREPRCVWKICHKHCVTSLQFDDHRVMSTAAGRMRVWDIRTGKCLHTFNTSAAVSVRFDDSKVVCGRHLNGNILIFDLHNMNILKMLEGPHYLCSWCLEFDKQHIVCGGGFDIEVWSPTEAAHQAPLENISFEF